MTNPNRTPGKFGKLPYNPHKPNIILQARHFTRSTETPVPPAPKTRDNLTPLAKSTGGMPMYGNDQYGDCVWAMIGHAIQLNTLIGAGDEITVETTALLKGYSDVTGFNPDDPNTDQGTNIQDALDYWRKTGIAKPDGTVDQIVMFAEVPHTNRALMAQALNMFGSLLLGVNFPGSAMDQFNAHEPWTVVKGATIEGGHAILGGAYTMVSASNMQTEIATWGAEQEVTDAWNSKYLEEAWVVITKDWLDKAGETPEGFNMTELVADFKVLTGAAPFPKSTDAHDSVDTEVVQ